MTVVSVGRALLSVCGLGTGKSARPTAVILAPLLSLVCILDCALGVQLTEKEIEHPPARTPAEAETQFAVAEGLKVNLVVGEPQVTQPLSISFDDRGRMWVLQYRQYPNPNGLKAVDMDHWLRTKYEKLPEPPPIGPKGQDRISVYEDFNGDGRADTSRDFVSDLNLASGMTVGHGGVFVVQPPYLLFYPDRDKDDVPDGPPEVLLQGFGLEDAHAFANSLTWGPDGWLYGAQGSTATANIRGIGFQQGVWRYHPLTREFELFAEGGGNSWGVEFDRFGNLFSAGNEVELLVHLVQGAYYVKGFGKHGPLHNPHAYGYFQPVQHHGYLGDSLSGGAILYQGGAFPARFNNACIAPHTRHSAVRWATVETRTSTFATRAVGDFLTSKDIWFRPVDMTVGPDGAVYVADWYDYNISHSSPTNRSQWYQPSRLDGRVWRVAPPDVIPIAGKSFDLSAKSNQELIELLAHANDWYARQARRILAERRDPAVVPTLVKLALESTDQRLALQALWSIHVSDGLDDRLAAKTLHSSHEYVRAWTIRLLGDRRKVSSDIANRLIKMAESDPSAIVRSQLACTAKRLSGGPALDIVERLLRHDEDIADVHIPFLVWWAIENKAISDTSRALEIFQSPDAWTRPIARKVVIERLARRFAAEGTPTAFGAAARLLELARSHDDQDLVASGIVQALAGRKVTTSSNALERLVEQQLARPLASVPLVELGLRLGIASATEPAIAWMKSPDATAEQRASIINALGDTTTIRALDELLALLGSSEPPVVQSAALGALGSFNSDRIPEQVIARFPKLNALSQSRAIELLCSRPGAALELLKAIDRQAIPATAVTLDQVRQLREMNDGRIASFTDKHWGKIQVTSPLEMRGRVTAVQQMLGRGRGDATKGRELFRTACATCHKLHGQGEAIGPDLTAAERKNRELLVMNVVDPSSVIRQQYISHVAVTTDGRTLTGLLADSTAETVTLLDAKNNRTVLNRSALEQLKESSVSLMPEKLLDALTDRQIRDLFAYIQSEDQAP